MKTRWLAIEFLICLALMVCQAGYGQSVLDTRLDGSEQGKALTEYLQEFEQSHPVRFYFLNNWLDSLSLRGELKGPPLRDALYDLLLGTDVNFIEVNPHAIVFVKDPAQQLLRNQLLSAAATRSQAKIEKILIGRRENNRKQRVTLSGTVTDAKTRNPLVGVNVLATDLKVGSATDSQGRFEFKLPAGEHVLTFNYVSFEEKVLDLEIFATGSIRIELEEVPTVLDEVLIQDSRRDITTTGLGQTQISMKEVKRAPAMLGEVDLVKQIQILPGVTSVGEAASGYNVRGGSVDQNLILYDGMPIFNSSHVFGFFSSFNAEASNRKFVRMDPQRSLESALFITDQFDVFPRMHVDAGLRLSAFHALGPSNINIYAPGVPRETINLIDTVKYGSGQSVTSFLNPEPRLAIRYELSGESSIKIGYNRIFQYLHLVTNTTAVTPVDIWQPSGPYFKPQMADQVSIGYFRNFKQRAYEVFAEVYYKKIDNVLDFKDGYSLILNPQVETALLQGKARAYGAEFQVAKNQGRLVGSLSYAYSRSLRTFQGLYPVETINNGKEYASNYDQPHVVNLQWRYNISRRFFFTGIFTYRTGRPITLPLSAFTINYVTVSSFSDRNQYRIPDYHRLDLALVIEGNHKRRRILDGTWTFSIYNVYGRKNPYSVFFKEVRPGILRPYRLAIIGSALPSITYSFKI